MATVVVASMWFQPAAAQTVDEVLAKHFAAIGGVEGWRGLQTLKASGTISISGGMMEGPFSIVQKRPAKARIEMMLQGMQIVQAYDGKTAWQIMPFSGSTEPQQADPQTAQLIIEQADLDGPLIGWREDGHQVRLLGREVLEGTEVLKLELTQKNGSVSYYYLDAARYVPLKIEGLSAGTQTGTRFRDYRSVGGLLFPYSITIDTPIGQQVLTFTTVQINVPVDDRVFSMSAG